MQLRRAALLAVCVALAQCCVLYVAESGNATTRTCGRRDEPCAQLRWALDEAEQGGCTIELRGVIAGPGNDQLVLKAVLGSVELVCRDGATLRAASPTWFAQLEPQVAVTIRECLVEGFGGGPVFAVAPSASLSLVDSQLVRNSGGVIVAQSNTRVSVTRCVLANNSNVLGGSLAAEGGALVNVTDSLFAQGSALNGGHMALQSGTRVVISNCTFQDGWARQNGGSIFVDGAVASCVNCTFERNGGAGTVVVFSGRLLLNHSVILASYGAFGAIQAKNPGTYVELNDVRVERCTGLGVVFIADGALHVRNSQFRRNVVARGGAITAVTAAKVRIDDSVVDGNVAEFGGALYAEYSVSMWITNVSIVGNRATTEGGACWCSASHFVFAGTGFRGNSDPANADADFFCSPFPVHSPCIVEGRAIVCPDDPDALPSMWTPITIAVMCVSIVLFIAASVLVAFTVRAARLKRAARATEMRTSIGGHDDDEAASLMEPDFVNDDDDWE